MGRYRDDGEVQIDNSTNGRSRNDFQWFIVIAASNVGTLLRESLYVTVAPPSQEQRRFQCWSHGVMVFRRNQDRLHAHRRLPL